MVMPKKTMTAMTITSRMVMVPPVPRRFFQHNATMGAPVGARENQARRFLRGLTADCQRAPCQLPARMAARRTACRCEASSEASSNATFEFTTQR